MNYVKSISFAAATALFTSLFSIAAQARHIEHVFLGFSHELAGVLKDGFTVETKDMSCYISDGQFSNGVAWDVATVAVAKITTIEGKIIKFDRPITAGLLPGQQGTCDLFEYAVEGKKTITAEFFGDVATRLYTLKGINDPTKW